jgi:hypothetical protein
MDSSRGTQRNSKVSLGAQVLTSSAIPRYPWSSFFFFVCQHGVSIQGLTLARRALEPLHQPFFFFLMGFFEIGSCELFAEVGFEPRSS